MDSNKKSGQHGLRGEIVNTVLPVETMLPIFSQSSVAAAQAAQAEFFQSAHPAGVPVFSESIRPAIEMAADAADGQSGVVSNSATFDDMRQRLLGSEQHGAMTEIFDNSNRTFDAPKALVQGEHVFTVAGANLSPEPLTVPAAAPDGVKPAITFAYDEVGKMGELVNGSTTDDAAPILRGRGEPNSQAVVYDNGEPIGHVNANEDGNWLFRVPNALELGEHVFTVVSAGVSSEPFTLTVSPLDGAKPVIDAAFDDFGAVGELLNGSTTDDATPTLRGHGEPNSQAEIYDNGKFIGYANPDDSGNWTFHIYKALEQGEHVFTVAGSGVVSEPFTLTVGAPDGIKPVIESAFDDVGTVGELLNGSTTDDATPTLRGHGQPNSQAVVYDNGKFIGYANSDDSGNWICNISPALAQGEHVFTVVGAGVSSEPFVLNVELGDAVKLVIESAFDDVGTVGEIANGGTTDDASPVFHGRGGVPGTQIFLFEKGALIGSGWVEQDGSWKLADFAPLSSGEHALTVMNDGKTSEPFMLNVEAGDAVKLVIESAFDDVGTVGEIANGGTTDDASPVFHGRGGVPGTQIFLFEKGALIGSGWVEQDGSWKLADFAPLSSGEHALTVMNDGKTSEPFMLNVEAGDAVKLVIESAFDDVGTVGEIANGGTTDDASPVFHGHGGVPGTQIFLFEKGALIGSGWVEQDGSWKLTDFAPLSSGEHALTVMNDGKMSEPFVLNVELGDTAKLVIESAFDDFGKMGELLNGGTTDDTTPTLRGHGQPNSQAVVYDNGKFIGYANSDDNGNWICNVSQALEQGEHVFTVVGAGVSSEPFVLTIGAPDGAKPVIEFVADNIGAEMGELVSGSTTDDARPQFHGQGQPGAQVFLYQDGVQVGRDWVDTEGNWSAFPQEPLAPGAHEFTVQIGETISEPFMLTLENIPAAPALTIDSALDDAGMAGIIANGGATDDQNPTFTGHGDPDSIVAIFDNGHLIDTSRVQADGSWTIQVGAENPFDPGTHTITASLDGVTFTQPFVLHVDAATVVVPEAQTSDSLATLRISDLLQAPGELFAAEPDLLPSKDISHALDLAQEFAESAGGISVAPQVVMPVELWQEQPA